MVIRHRSVVRTRKMLRAFLKTCRAVQLLHACVVKFRVSGTVVTHTNLILLFTPALYSSTLVIKPFKRSIKLKFLLQHYRPVFFYT